MLTSCQRKGFTLIELLIVITIIGILAVALIPRITGGPSRARDATRKTDLEQIAQALESYASDHAGLYPALSSGVAGCMSTVTSLSTYLTTIPADPSGIGVASGTGRCGNDYTYYPLKTGGASVPNGYLLLAKLESTNVSDASAYKWVYPGTLSNTSSSQTNLATLTSCAATSCSTGAMIVVAR